MAEIRPFLQELAEEIYPKYKDRLEQLTIVFPNRRAGLFFRKHLAKCIDKPIWSPSVVSIEDFIQQLSPYQKPDRLSLIFRLYKSYKKFNPGEENFDRFYYWGEMLLRDFDDLDKYLIPAKTLFRDLSSQKELDTAYDFLSDEQKEIILKFWHQFGEKDSSQKESFRKLWQTLFKVYDHFKEQLHLNNLAYEGMLHRAVVEQMGSGEFQHGHTDIVFAGFNALALTEEKIIGWFVENHQAEIYWDLDAYYMNDTRQEAGGFLRDYKKKTVFEQSFKANVPNNLLSTDKHVKITGVPLEVGQAKILGQRLEALSKEKENAFDPQKTVVVLAEEHLLFPVLHSLPTKVDKVNVTMGFPLRNTPLFSLFEYLIALQQGAKKEENQTFFSYRQVLSILKHPNVYNLNSEVVGGTIRLIESENIIEIPAKELVEQENFYQTIFQPLEKPEQVFDYLLEILLLVEKSHSEEGKGQLEEEYIYHFYTQLNRLKEVIREEKISLTLGSFLRLFRQLISSMRLPFTGEPLNGLQVMGLLETRNLDFENVFILSLNEGAVPAGRKQHSFIPYNLRRAYGLPTFDQQDAIYAYIFYRLIQRASNVQMFYNTQNGIKSGGEISRFALQLLYESGLDIQRTTLASNVVNTQAEEITIRKSDEVLALMQKYLAKGEKKLTPSALNTYLDCKLKFYFRYLVTLYAQEELEEDVDARVFGNLLHHTMEWLYEDFVKNKGSNSIEKEDFERIKKLLDPVIERAFKKQYGMAESERRFRFLGRNVIARDIIRKFVLKILENDLAYAPFNIIGLEADEKDGFTMELPIKIGDGHNQVSLKGIIDRVDEKDGIVRVVDYKTGKDDRKFDTLGSLFDHSDKGRNKAAIQTLYYALLFSEAQPQQVLPIKPGLFNSKDMFADNFDITLKIKGEGRSYDVVEDARPLLPDYKNHLIGLLEEIFDPNGSFDQTDDLDKCRNCDYKGICRRF